MATNKAPYLKNDAYDSLKKAVMVGLPILATLYVALAKIFGWPHPEEVAAAITGATAFLGTTLHISTKAYNASEDKFDGTMEVSEVGGRMALQPVFVSEEQAKAMTGLDQAVFKINKV